MEPRPVVKGGSAAATKPERMVGRCEMFDQIASGGMATIHIGRMVGAGGFTRTVAIKRLHPQFAHDVEFVDMFLDEARIVARIRHPNVVATLDLVEEEGDLFIIMEYVEGLSFGVLLNAAREKGERPPPGISARIVTETLHGLHAAHEAHDEHGRPLALVHRDVSPDNILVGVDGYPRVLDFGVARAMGRISTTRQGHVKGKLAYMAPEQVLGQPLDRRTDVFAASAVLWQALTGHRLFKASNAAELAHRVLDMTVEPPSKVTPDVPKKFDGIVLRGLEMDPARRWRTAMTMAEALEAVGGLASNREVGLWVRRLGAERLSRLASQVSALERKPVGDEHQISRKVQPRSQIGTPGSELDAAVEQTRADAEQEGGALKGPPSPEDTGEIPIIADSAFLLGAQSGEFAIGAGPIARADAEAAFDRAERETTRPTPRHTAPPATPARPPRPAATPAAAKSPAAKPAAAKPPAGKPAAAKSPAGKPAAAKPPAEKPAAAKPPAEKPASSEPPMAAAEPAVPPSGPVMLASRREKKRSWWWMLGAAVGLLVIATGLGVVLKGVLGKGSPRDEASSTPTAVASGAEGASPTSPPSAPSAATASTAAAEPSSSEPAPSASLAAPTQSTTAPATAAPTPRPVPTGPGTVRPGVKPKPTSTAKPKSTGLYGRQ